MAGTFSAQVDAWCLKSERRLLAVRNEAVQRTVSIAQSRIQIEFGFARASVRASTASMPPIDPSFDNKASQTFAYDASEIVLVIAGAPLHATIYIGWTANYVGHLNNGTSKMAGSHFVDLAALQWQATVSQVVAEAKARVG